jgi:hypothetical protein
MISCATALSAVNATTTTSLIHVSGSLFTQSLSRFGKVLSEVEEVQHSRGLKCTSCADPHPARSLQLQHDTARSSFESHFAVFRAYCSLAYSALACFRTGMSGSASFQRRQRWDELLLRQPDFAHQLSKAQV